MNDVFDTYSAYPCGSPDTYSPAEHGDSPAEHGDFTAFARSQVTTVAVTDTLVPRDEFLEGPFLGALPSDMKERLLELAVFLGLDCEDGIADAAALGTLITSGAMPAQRHAKAPYMTVAWPPSADQPVVLSPTTMQERFHLSPVTWHRYIGTLRAAGLLAGHVARFHDVMWLYARPLLVTATGIPEKLLENPRVLLWVTAEARRARPQVTSRPARITRKEIGEALMWVKANRKTPLSRLWMGERDYAPSITQDRTLPDLWAGRKVEYGTI